MNNKLKKLREEDIDYIYEYLDNLASSDRDMDIAIENLTNELFKLKKALERKRYGYKN